MLRPNATKIIVTRDEIRYLGSKGPFPRYLYDRHLSLASRSDWSTVNPVPNLHVARGLHVRTRTRGIGNVGASGSDETSVLHASQPLNPSHNYGQSPETIVAFVGMRGNRPRRAMPRASRGLHETPQQSPEASEDTTDSRNPLLFARDMPSLVGTRYISEPEKQQEYRDGELSTSRLNPTTFPLAASAEPLVMPVSKGQEAPDDTQTRATRSHHEIDSPSVPMSHMSLNTSTAVASLDEHGTPRAEPHPGSDMIPVYTDMLGLLPRPQTPLNSPWSHHRSRLEAASPIGSGGRAFAAANQEAPSLTGRRQRREGSPAGLQTPDFVGLFGGMGNANESVAS